MPRYEPHSIEPSFSPGTFEFNPTNYLVSENLVGTTNVTLTVLRTNGLHGLVSVDYWTVDGTARRGQDYTYVSNRLKLLERSGQSDHHGSHPA